MRSLITFALILICSTLTWAQKDRYKFAQTYIGTQADVIGGADSPEFISGRFLIGGTHFWQKADFYISFPLITLALEDTNWDFGEGVITGFRYIPFGLSKKGPRPFFGVQWLTPDFRIDNGPVIERSKFGIQGGLTLAFGSLFTLEVSGHHVLNQDVYYPTSRMQSQTFNPPDFGVSLGIKKYMDTTSNLSKSEVQEFQRQRYSRFEEEGKLSTWSIGIGLSANVSTSDIPALRAYDFLPNRPPLSLFPDVVAGYYFHKADAAIRASWRPLKLSDKAYGLDYEIRQNRIGIEAFKFLFDYKGFVPFLGVTAGMDYLDYEIADIEGPGFSGTYSTFSYGIAFGWDIRVTETDPYILRTNLRYIFQSDPSGNELNVSGQHLEINFIQLVLYPGRWN